MSKPRGASGQRRKRSISNPQSKKVQDDVAKRFKDLAEEQMMDAIQRQVGATRADWTDAADPDMESKTKEQTEEPTAEKEKDTSPPPPREEKKESRNPGRGHAPSKRFPDGSVLYTSDQFD